MTDDREKEQPNSDANLEREIRQGRNFTAEEVIGRLAGPGAMKGASPVSPQQQAEIAVGSWLRRHLRDPCGCLAAVLHRHLKGSQLLLDSLDDPSEAAAAYCRLLLASNLRLEEVVREADVEWGITMDERPRFEREGRAADADDPYTIASVRDALGQAVQQS
jgi:hypothetical protein